LAFSYWIDNLGFITEGKLTAIFIKPSLGVFNWPVIYFINYTPTSSLTLFITAPSVFFLYLLKDATQPLDTNLDQRLIRVRLPGIKLGCQHTSMWRDMAQQFGSMELHHRRLCRPRSNLASWLFFYKTDTSIQDVSLKKDTLIVLGKAILNMEGSQ
jgi:hypothetical protein